MDEKDPLIPSPPTSSTSTGVINNYSVIKSPRHVQTSTATDDVITDKGSHHEHAESDNPHLHDVAEKDDHIPVKTSDSRTVFIEIPAFLFFMSFMNFNPILQYYLTDRLTRELGVPNVTMGCLDDPGNGNGSALADRIQDKVAWYTMMTTFLTNCPAIVPSLFMGSFSDRFGRKPTLCIVSLGTIIRMVIYALVFHFHWPVEYVYIGCVAEGLTGSYGVFVMSVFAVAADVTKEGGKRRSFKIALTEAANMVGASAGGTMCGYWVSNLGFVPPVLFSVGVQVLLIFIVVVFIPETAACSRQHSRLNCSFLLRSCRVFLRRGRRCFLFTGLVTFFLALLTLAGNTIIILLYLLHPPFCWAETHISVYNGVYLLTSWLTILSLTSCLGTRVADDTLALVGALSGIVGFIFQGLSMSDLFTYLAAATSLLANLTWPMLRTMLSKQVDQDEQGSLFAGIALAEMLSTTTSGIVTPTIYRLSLGHVHGLIFLCFAGVDVLVALCIISFIVRRKVWGKAMGKGSEYSVS